ncbi:hypothetical protein BJ742DRAFT_674927 [Cladochytrium replicatum]|nr:hypothetical protein BJ742DRAFT_674927 [Cladochytrium replicatum]
MVADWLTEGLHPSIDTDYHIVHIKCGRNNTIASLSDALGNVKFTVSGGHCGFRKAGRGNQDVAYQVVTELVKRSAEGRKSKPKKKDVEPHMIKTDVRSIHLKLNGFGPGRTQAFRAIRASGWDVKRITDVTPIRRGGCRPPKKRRL